MRSIWARTTRLLLAACLLVVIAAGILGSSKNHTPGAHASDHSAPCVLCAISTAEHRPIDPVALVRPLAPIAILVAIFRATPPPARPVRPLGARGPPSALVG